MKVVVNAMSARLGGGRTYLVNLFAHLPPRSDLELLVFAPDDLVLAEDSRIRRVRTAWPTTNPLLRTLWEMFALPAYLRRVGADVLFCPGGVVATTAPAGCKVVTMFRNMIPFDDRVRASIPFGLQRIRNWLLHGTMLRSMARADLTIFISDYARKVIERLVPIRNPVTIPHGISDAFRTAERQLARSPNVPGGDYVLYVSRFDVYKHHQQVVAGYAQLPAALREQFPLVLVGEDDMPLAQKTRQLIRELQLEGQVILLGPVPYGELPTVYRHAFATLFASSCENCPNILLEALAAGRPVLSSNVMPMPEFGGEGIEYFSPYDADDIAAKLLAVLTDRERAQSIAREARRRSDRYEWSVTARDTWSQILMLAPHEAAAG
jgi:glycosyltransferase involved in cell wall biosynthesis